MKTPALLLIPLSLLFLSFNKSPIPKKENPKPLILHQVVIDSELFEEFTYTPQNKINEEKTKCQYTKYIYNEKDQLISKTTYMDVSLASSDSRVLEELRSRKEWINATTSGPYIQVFKDSCEYNSNGQLTRINKTNISQGYRQSSYWTFNYEAKKRMSLWSAYNDGKRNRILEYQYDKKGNLIKISDYDLDSTNHLRLQVTHEYEFDDKINPFHSFGPISDPFGKYTNVNNIIRDKYTLFMEKSDVSVTKYEYEYNDEGYPVSLNQHTKFVYK